MRSKKTRLSDVTGRALMSAIRSLLRPKSVAAGWAALARCNGNVTAPALRPHSPYCISSAVGTRHMSSNGRRPFLVDTLGQGVPSNHEEAITESFVSKEEMEKSGMIQDSKLEKDFKLNKFKSEVQSSQEHHFSLLQCETEKLRSDIEKMHSELRRIHDELGKQNAQTTSLTTKRDQEIHELQNQLGVIGSVVLIFVIISAIFDILLFIVHAISDILMSIVHAITDILMWRQFSFAKSNLTWSK